MQNGRRTWPNDSKCPAKWKVTMPKCSKYHAKWQILVPNCCKYKANCTRKESQNKIQNLSQKKIQKLFWTYREPQIQWDISIHLHVHRSLKPKFLKDVRWGIASMEYAEVHKRIQWLGALWMATIDDWCIQPGTSRGLWTLIIYFVGPLDMFTFYAEDAAIRTSVTPWRKHR